ncbi:3-phytase A [Fusarium oxysporum f. sp. albedinis]|nr:3-phytase A [Fusarium oxysporum f. sp. albedinis]
MLENLDMVLAVSSSPGRFANISLCLRAWSSSLLPFQTERMIGYTLQSPLPQHAYSVILWRESNHVKKLSC